MVIKKKSQKKAKSKGRKLFRNAPKEEKKQIDGEGDEQIEEAKPKKKVKFGKNSGGDVIVTKLHRGGKKVIC